MYILGTKDKKYFKGSSESGSRTPTYPTQNTMEIISTYKIGLTTDITKIPNRFLFGTKEKAEFHLRYLVNETKKDETYTNISNGYISTRMYKTAVARKTVESLSVIAHSTPTITKRTFNNMAKGKCTVHIKSYNDIACRVCNIELSNGEVVCNIGNDSICVHCMKRMSDELSQRYNKLQHAEAMTNAWNIERVVNEL